MSRRRAGSARDEEAVTPSDGRTGFVAVGATVAVVAIGPKPASFHVMICTWSDGRRAARGPMTLAVRAEERDLARQPWATRTT